MTKQCLIKGEAYKDERGTVSFINAFNMSEVVRLYEIAPKDQLGIRAWQGHRFEKKWFYCISGSFVINIIKLDDFHSPSQDLVPERIVLQSIYPEILSVPNGFVTGIKAIAPNSRLQIFSNFDLGESQQDDYRFPLDQWSAKW